MLGSSATSPAGERCVGGGRRRATRSSVIQWVLTTYTTNAGWANGRSGLSDEHAISPNDHLEVSRPVLLKQ